MKLRYTRRARQHLESIAEYISEQNPSAAIEVGESIRGANRLLESFPRIGREGVLSGTRELVVPSRPYIIVYRFELDDDSIVVLGIYHGAQLRPGQA